MDTHNGTTAAAVPPSSVDVVIVNWNAGDQLAACIASVEAHDPAVVARLIVIDNGSTDASLQNLPHWDKLTVDATGDNLGFGRACNRGAAQGSAPLILLLNPDTRLIEPAISAAVTYLQSDASAEIGICGVRQLDDTGHIACSCAYFPSAFTFAGIILGLHRLAPGRLRSLLMTDFDHEHSRVVDHVQGAFYLIRRSLFEALGGFDDDYFVYYEDLDLSLRARQHGWATYFLADPKIFHRGGGTSSQVKGRARFYAMEARLIYARKHYSLLANVALFLLTLFVEPFTTSAWQLIRYRGRGLGSIAQAFGLFYRNVPKLLLGGVSGARL